MQLLLPLLLLGVSLVGCKLLSAKSRATALDIRFTPLAGEAALDSNPVYSEGLTGLSQYVWKNLRYPPLYLRMTIDGSSLVGFTIDSTGQVSNHRIVKPFLPACDEEALRVIKLLPGTWQPAQRAGKAVGTECQIPVSFSIRH
ncbi:energy transducer TonB [Hymenobacter guriensis]|uniref:energy transducer TonB n=1 Tax=Hymenobacter guriensis TaxID=2793065 RepID=UPI001E53C386|nr:energy transducer TonB [Hymenobacter guriensis]